MSFNQFRERLLSSGLITQKSFDEFLASCTEDQCATAEDLARELLNAKLLTKYQLQLISQGMGQLLSFGDYVLQERIGSGGMGTVYRAVHTKMNRAVAIKILNPKLSSNPSLLERFDREVRATAKLQHLNIVHAYDAGEYNRAHFLVMELVEGVDLNRVIAEKGPLSVTHALECITQVAEGLKYAHAQGIIHRDVKPSNILLSRSGVIKLSDMGLVRVSCDWDDSDIARLNANLSRTGLLMGSVNFMAPEQAMDSRDTDERSDIYALGATLYFLLTGQTMFSADTATKTILALQTSTPPSIRTLRDDVGDELDAVYLKMVARHPDDRFRTMGHVLDAIRKFNESNSAEGTLSAPEAPATSLSKSHIFDSDLSQDFWVERAEQRVMERSQLKQSVNVLDDDSDHEESNDPTLMQMLPVKTDSRENKPDSEYLDSSILLKQVTRSNQLAMLAVIVPLSLAMIYFLLRSFQQTPASALQSNASQSRSANQAPRSVELRELLPDLDEEVWTVLIPEQLTTESGAKIEADRDGVIVVTGAGGKSDRYTLSSTFDAQRVTGVRLEVIPPRDASGADDPSAGEFHLTEFALQTHSDAALSSTLPARFRAAYADDYQSRSSTGEPLFVTNVLDGNSESAWGVGSRFRLPHWVIFETAPHSVSSITKAVTMSLASGDRDGTADRLRRFRILVTDKPRPMLQEMIRKGNLSDVEKRAAAYLILGNPREASDLLQTAVAEGNPDSGTRLTLLAIALHEQLLIGPARKTAEKLATWLGENRTGHSQLLSLAENVLVEVGGLDHQETGQILDGSKLESQVAAWTAKLQEMPFAQSEHSLRRRAETYARLGQWKKAAADYLKISRSGEPGEIVSRQTLVALALSNDAESYRDFCRFLSEKYAERELDTVSAQRLCEGLLLRPDGSAFAGKFVEILARESPQTPENFRAIPVLLATRGLAYYRVHQPQEALNIVNRAIGEIDSRDEPDRRNQAPIRALALTVRSLALQELGNSSEAATSLHEARALIPSLWRKIVDPAQTEAVIFEREEFDWDWLIAAILLREAETSGSEQQSDAKQNDALAL
ncbi:MAG TPA: serine/threonine-protein kinase [Planctomycetaceae bacterium]|nr:serine/threonine-protein kinase [Planctomycetaceae bacterium]